MIRYIFKPRISMFDGACMGLVFGSVPHIGWWSLLAGLFLCAVSTAIEVAIVGVENDPR